MGKKKFFVYFMSMEGGMDAILILRKEELVNTLPSWLSDLTREEDRKLEDWMETAEIGDVADHRMGYLVRTTDVSHLDLWGPSKVIRD